MEGTGTYLSKKKWIFTSCLVILIILIACFAYMESRNNYYVDEVASTEPQKIMKEMPELLISDAEMEFSKIVFDIPKIRESRQESEILTVVFMNEIGEQIRSVIPENSENIEISVYNNTVYIDFFSNGKRTILEYTDVDLDDNVDLISKTMATPKGKDGEVKKVYNLQYDVDKGTYQYEKLVLKRVWFSYLRKSQ